MTTPTPADRLTAERIVRDFIRDGDELIAGRTRIDHIATAIAAALCEQRDAHYSDLLTVRGILTGQEFCEAYQSTLDFVDERMAVMTGGPTEVNL
jgi:hypothetical protein